jgi:lysozyme
MTRRINDAGLALIKSFESFQPKAYKRAGDVWTIGYGHTENVTQNTPDIDQGEATLLLRDDLAEAERYVDIGVRTSINDNQFSALVSFCFNEGCGRLNGSTLLKLVNAGQFEQAAEQFQKWIYGKDGHGNEIVLDGLVRRRDAEKALFLTSPETTP